MKNNMHKKGSFTVEAACVMAVILFVIMGVLYLNFFVHNRTWLTAAAYESALAGSIEGTKQKGKSYETAKMRSEELGNAGFFGAENLTVKTTVEKNVKVIYEADTVAEFFGFSWDLKAEGESKIICPATWIRKIKAASEIIGG